MSEPCLAIGDSQETSTPAAGPISPLELLHPDGAIQSAHVYGQACPPRLTPTIANKHSGTADLMIVAPSLAECRGQDWFERTADSVVNRLARNGLMYGLVPARWRLSASRLWRDRGLVVEMAVLHVPDWSASRYLVPLRPESTAYALSHLIPAPAWKRRLLSAAHTCPAAVQLLEYVLPSVALVARRPGARPLIEWLFRLDGDTARSHAAILSTSWRGGAGSIVVHRPADGRWSADVAKLSWAAAGQAEPNELIPLAELGPMARTAGARVPTFRGQGRMGGHPVMRQHVLDGRLFAILLNERPRRARTLMPLVADWLEAWNRYTAAVPMMGSEHLRHEILCPAAELAPRLVDGDAYQAWLVERCSSLRGAVPLVAAHRDLTSWNLLLDEAGGLGVVDWAEARGDSLPLGDFFYAMTDIALWARVGGADRLTAFHACFAPGGQYQPFVHARLQRQRQILGLSTEMVELCLHATFLNHARDEYRQQGADGPYPFLRVVEWLAANRVVVRRWLAAGTA
jgi:hypothetical protein